MSEHGSLEADAWNDALRKYMRAPTPMSTIVLLTPRETAKHLRTTERTLERRRLTGDGPPYVKIGALIRYPLSELEKWLAGRLQRSTSETAASPNRKPRRRGRSKASSGTIRSFEHEPVK